MASANAKPGISRQSRIVLLVVGAVGLAVVGCLCYAYWRISTSPGFPHSSSWEVGPVDMTSPETQVLSFVYTPGVNVPEELFSIEFRGLPLDNPEWVAPACEFVLSIKDDERVLCTLHMTTQWCNWHKPNAGVVGVPESLELIPVETLESGKTYEIEFTMMGPIQVPENVKTVLHGKFVWRGTPTQLVRDECR
ncbi:MAG: hypothetical protein JXA69_11360 [Phycisphaerae bacterium]|nr:hypothetical protein [Phycisphaerae bacterium]